MAPTPKSPHPYVEEDRGYSSPCWVWQRAASGAGYGMMRDGPRLVLAHRFFYERAFGPIPDGKEIDHLCGVTACVNPDHLDAVTHAENCKRGRHVKINERLAAEIRERLDNGELPSEIAGDYGVVPDHIRAIRRGVRWATA
jgi:hypothetical protein